ncbi:MAG: response regulator [Leptolyngbya sp. SIOISBB]|nr:response regulator [Leptolyngbya sp. SIOISBB]
MMPGIDGLETCRRLKENPATCEVPVIFMTVLDDVDHKVHGLSLGAVDYITKPFNESEVLARVLAHLKTHDLLHKIQEQNYQLKQEIVLRKKTEHKLRKLNRELQRIQIELLHKERLSSIAEMVTGIANEINNPIGCISGNIEFLQEYSKNILRHLDLYQQQGVEESALITQHAHDIELNYIRQDLPTVIESIQRSTNRIVAISKFIKIFDRYDIQQNKKYEFDIHELLDGALLLLKHRLKPETDRAAIEVTRTYGDLPRVPCFPGQLNQAFTDVLSILIDAFDERCKLSPDASTNSLTHWQEQTPLQIQIRTTIEMSWVIIRIRGNTSALLTEPQFASPEPSAESSPLFGNFDVELLIARQIVVDTHGG